MNLVKTIIRSLKNDPQAWELRPRDNGYNPRDFSLCCGSLRIHLQKEYSSDNDTHFKKIYTMHAGQAVYAKISLWERWKLVRAIDRWRRVVGTLAIKATPAGYSNEELKEIAMEYLTNCPELALTSSSSLVRRFAELNIPKKEENESKE